MRKPVILLACGCFNPTTNMHLRLFELARDYLQKMGQYEVIGGIISPVHDAYGKKDLESSTHRLNMLKLALQGNDWVKLSEWEANQESWTKTRQILQYHQNQVNAYIQSPEYSMDNNETDLSWMPNNIRKKCSNVSVTVKLLCGADLLESFGTPGLWSDDDIETIVGQHGLVVISRANANPSEFIYNSDLLTKFMFNIIVVTEWIRNEISSMKVRRALRRAESVKYLIPDKVIEYIHKHMLYGSGKTKYVTSANVNASDYITPSSAVISIEPASPTSCLRICNNNVLNRNSKYDKLTIDTVDSFRGRSLFNHPHPGQAVKINTSISKEVGFAGESTRGLKCSKSCANFEELDRGGSIQQKSEPRLKEYKSCDENLVKFIFTKHGIKVISDTETIV